MAETQALINWYPGHIAKAQRVLREQLSLIDLVLELVDARTPLSGRFDDTAKLLGAKRRVLVYTKGDLAESAVTAAWIAQARKNGETVVSLNAQTGDGLLGLRKVLDAEADRIREKMAGRGRLPRPARVMVVGMPNVGKSSLINKLAKKRTAQVGDKAGVTKSVRWVRLGAMLELMDTPGIIPPKLDDQELALKLALIGSVSHEAYDPILVAPAAIALLQKVAPKTLANLEEPTVEAFAKARGFVLPGGHPNLDRAAKTFLSDLRSGSLGPVSLDGFPAAADAEFTLPGVPSP